MQPVLNRDGVTWVRGVSHESPIEALVRQWEEKRWNINNGKIPKLKKVMLRSSGGRKTTTIHNKPYERFLLFGGRTCEMAR